MNWKAVLLGKARLFHAFNPSDMTFRHNIAICKGVLRAVSFMRRHDPNIQGMVTPYEVLNEHQAKEAAFELVRSERFPEAPSRLGSIFLFPTRSDADIANERWWGGSQIILEATVVAADRFGLFDAKHLHAHQPEWEAAAEKYWSGQMTEEPSPEIIVEGLLQLHGWEPYGVLFGGLSEP